MSVKKMYLTTGEFAKLCNVSKHTLFHYNDIDVFMPEYINEKGYRYYHVLQYDTFCTITQLRTIGMTLAEIKAYLKDRSPEELIKLFSQQEVLIDMQIKKLRQIKASLHGTREEVEQAVLSNEKIIICDVKQEHLQLSKILIDADDFEMTIAFGELMNSVRASGFRNISGMIHNTNDLMENNYNKNCLFYLRTSCKKKKCNCTVKPAGKYLITYHHGGYEELYKTYQVLLSDAICNNLILGERFYEEIVIGDWAVNNSNDYVIKVSVEIVSK